MRTDEPKKFKCQVGNTVYHCIASIWPGFSTRDYSVKAYAEQEPETVFGFSLMMTGMSGSDRALYTCNVVRVTHSRTKSVVLDMIHIDPIGTRQIAPMKFEAVMEAIEAWRHNHERRHDHELVN